MPSRARPCSSHTCWIFAMVLASMFPQMYGAVLRVHFILVLCSSKAKAPFIKAFCQNASGGCLLGIDPSTIKIVTSLHFCLYPALSSIWRHRDVGPSRRPFADSFLVRLLEAAISAHLPGRSSSLSQCSLVALRETFTSSSLWGYRSPLLRCSYGVLLELEDNIAEIVRQKCFQRYRQERKGILQFVLWIIQIRPDRITVLGARIFLFCRVILHHELTAKTLSRLLDGAMLVIAIYLEKFILEPLKKSGAVNVRDR